MVEKLGHRNTDRAERIVYSLKTSSKTLPKAITANGCKNLFWKSKPTTSFRGKFSILEIKFLRGVELASDKDKY